MKTGWNPSANHFIWDDFNLQGSNGSFEFVSFVVLWENCQLCFWLSLCREVSFVGCPWMCSIFDVMVKFCGCGLTCFQLSLFGFSSDMLALSCGIRLCSIWLLCWAVVVLLWWQKGCSIGSLNQKSTRIREEMADWSCRFS